jgi:hypothetical protein
VITQEDLRKELTYDPETGIFEWFVFHRRIGGSLRADFGGYKNGRRAIQINRQRLQANRAAWIYMHGEIPAGYVIDHIDGDPANNRFSNLRCITQKENAQNRRRRGTGMSGVTGVIPTKNGTWRVHGRKDGKVTFAGTFKTKRQAAAFAHHWRLCNYPGYVGRD